MSLQKSAVSFLKLQRSAGSQRNTRRAAYA
uniref:Uncharacterized protein n=1 Tax=Setaria viridis TaxID=4556 RepID=A0A4U6VNE7_SETVI|nr:hypothetical protein SEVIR_3G157401v2 [Setaria viridis]